MKKLVLSIAALVAISSAAFAGSTGGATTLSGEASPSCVITNTPGLTMAFNGFGDSTGNFNVAMVCTGGLNWTMTIDGGSNAAATRRAANGSKYLSYRLYTDAGMTQELGVSSSNTVAGTGSDSAQTVTIYSKVALADQATLPTAGLAYADTLNVNIAW
jgi:spore coat protein U-like protein